MGDKNDDKKYIHNRFQIEFNSVDALVPKNHLVRKIDKAINFNFIYNEFAELYSAFCAPSIDPVVNLNYYGLVFVWYFIIRQTIREIEVNIAYRWFIGYSFNEKYLIFNFQ